MPTGGRKRTIKYARTFSVLRIFTIRFWSSGVVNPAAICRLNFRFSSLSSSFVSFWRFDALLIEHPYGLSFSSLAVASDNEWCVDQDCRCECDQLTQTTHEVSTGSEESEDTCWSCPWSVNDEYWADSDNCQNITVCALLLTIAKHTIRPVNNYEL